MAFRLIFLGGLVASAISVPLSRRYTENELEEENCPFSERQNVQFVPKKSYIYSYKGKSEVVLKDRQSSNPTRLDWQAEVVLSFMTPCRMVLEVKNPVINGHSDPLLKELLIGKPLIATIKQGVIVKVVADRDDEPASLNFKKGILASIQNVLPELSPIVSSKTFVESDTLGNCPTMYTVKDESASYIIVKQKNHKECKHRMKDASQNLWSSIFMRFPIAPLSESRSECRQVIRKSDKIITSVECMDKNVISSVISSEMTAKQESKLSLVRVKDEVSKPQLKRPRVTDLKFEDAREPKTERVIPEVQKLFKKLCTTTEKEVENEAPTVMAKLIGYLHRVPEPKMKEFLSEIRRGSFCSQPHRLESLFLDAIAFVDNAGAVELMVQEMVNQKVRGGRTTLYTVGFHLMRKPCIHTIEALKPLFKSPQTPSTTLLAASSLLHRYITQNPHSMEEHPVREIQELLSQQIEENCRSSENTQERKAKVLTALKAAGNIGKMTEPLRNSVLKCLRTQEASVYVRVASAEAYRKTPCSKRPTRELIETALEQSQNTEVRISAYVASIYCARYEEAERIVEKVSEEHSTQVRAFVLSHLQNLQRSDAPHLAGLRYKLTLLNVPNDYQQDIRKHSRNFDLSYFMSTFGLGAGINTDLIYTEGSYLPRQIKTNLTANIYDQVINIGEFSVRAKELEQMVELLFGPEGYLSGKEIREIIEDVLVALQDKKSVISRVLNKYWKNENWEPRNRASVQEIMNMITSQERSSKSINFDAFARMFGREVAFTTFFSEPRKINFEKLTNKVLDLIQRIIIDVATSKDTSARALQMHFELNIPTIQGIPLNGKLISTLVSTWKVKNHATQKGLRLDVEPSIGVEVSAFLGYSFGAKVGVRGKTKIAVQPQIKVSTRMSHQKIEFTYDIPTKLKVLDVKVSNHMIVKLPSKPDQHQSTTRLSESSNPFCSQMLKSVLGVSVCVKGKIPLRREFFKMPLGDLEFYTEIEKVNPEKEVLIASGHYTLTDKEKRLTVQMEAPGSENPRKGEMGVEFNNDRETKSVKAFIVTPSRTQRAIQLDLQSRLSSQAVSGQFVVYYGHQKQLSRSDEVLVTNLKAGKRQQTLEGKFVAKTKSRLAKYLKLDIELDGSVKLSRTSIPVPINTDMRKFEVRMEVPNVIETQTYIRNSPNRSSKRNFDALFLIKTPKTDIIRMEATSKSSGFHNENYQSVVHAKAKLYRSPEFQIESEVMCNRQTKKAHFEFKTSNHVLATASAEIEQQKSGSYEAKAKLKAPTLLRSQYTLTGVIETKEPRNYEMKLTAKRDEEPVLRIEGPMSVQWTPNMLRSKSEMKLTLPKTRMTYLVKSKVNLQDERSTVALNLRKGTRTVMAVEAEIERPSRDAFVSVLDIMLPRVIDAKLRTEKSPRAVQFAFNGEMKPKTSEERKVKAQAQWSWESREVSARVQFDAERNPQKKFELSTHYDFNLPKKYAAAKGEWNMEGKKYRYTSELTLGLLSVHPGQNNEIRIKVLDPRGEEFLLEGQYNAKKSGRKTTVTTKATFKPFNRKLNEFDWSTTYDMSRLPYKVEMKTEGRFQAPLLRLNQFTARAESLLDWTNTEQKAIYKMEYSGEQMRSPNKVEFEIENNPRQLSGRTNIDVKYPTNLRVNGQAEIKKGQDQMISELSADLKAQLPNRKYHMTATKNSQITTFSVISNDVRVLLIEQSQYKTGQWYLKMTTPTQEIEGRSHVKPNSVSFTLYPNKKKSDHRYEAEGHYRHSEKEFATGFNIRYPGSKKNYGVSALFTKGEPDSQGIIDLDIFRKQSDRVRLSVKVRKEATKSYHFEADVKIPHQNFHPRIEADLAWSREIKGLELYARKSPSAEPSFILLGKASRTTHKNYILHAKLKTPSDYVESVSTVHLHELRNCRGGSLNGTVKSRNHGSYDFASSVCGPAYIEFGVKPNRENKMYMAKIGMRGHESAKIALDQVQTSYDWSCISCMLKYEPMVTLYGRPQYRPKIPIVALGVKLSSPYLLSFEAHYNDTGVNDYMRKVVYPAERTVKNIVEEMMEGIPRELREELVPRLPDVSHLISDWKPTLDKWREVTLQVTSRIMKETREITKQMDEMCREMRRKVQTLMREMERIMEDTFGINTAEVHRFFRKINSRVIKMDACPCEGRQCFEAKLRCLWRELKEIPVIRQVSKAVQNSDIIDWIKNEFRHFKNEMKGLFNHYFHEFMEKMRNIMNRFTEIPIVNKFMKWIEEIINNLTPPNEFELLTNAVRKMSGIYFSSKVIGMRFNVPLSSPVPSVSNAIHNLRVQVPMRSYWKHQKHPSSMIEYLARPYASTARLEKETLTTFDGLVIPFPSSDCEVLLAEVKGDKIEITRPTPKRSEVRVRLHTGREIELYLNEEKPPRVPALRNTRRVKLDGANVTEEGEEVTVQMRGMQLSVNRNTIEVKPKSWAFSKVNGMMGNHDNEMRNDVPTRSEVNYHPRANGPKHHVSQKSAIQMIQKYKSNRSCRLPRA